MKKITFIFVLYATIFAQATSYAAAPTRTYNYTSGSIISSSQVNTNEIAIYTYLQNGVDTFATGVITDTNIAAGASIQYSKLNLAGQIKNSDIVASAGIPYSKLTLTGSVVDGDIVSITSASKVSTASIYGNLPINIFNSGTSASSSTFWRGDGTWVNPSGRQEYTTGSGNWTAPTGVTRVFITGVAAGGGGGFVNGGNGAGGGAGGGVEKFALTVTPGNSYAYSIGAGGTGSGDASAGGTGGNTTFSTLTLYGGTGGHGTNVGVGGASIHGIFKGQDGGSLIGGSSIMGTGGQSANASATGYGAAGAGMLSGSGSGGNGTGGYLLLEW